MNARPVWAEISRSKLLHNFDLLRSLASPTELVAVVKANAYGHGAVACATALAASGAQWLGVTCAEEGVAIRAVCPDANIFVMCGLFPGEAETAFAHRLTPAIWEAAHVEEIGRLGKPLAVHLEIDTGMARQGVRLAELPALLDKLRAAASLRLEGVFTHFHSPEFLDGAANAAQLAQFVTAVDTIVARGFAPRWIHAGNSATTVTPAIVSALRNVAEQHGTSLLLRPGLSLYGCAPRFSGAGAADMSGLQPVLAWKARVASLRAIEAGETAGYCATFHAARRTRLALLPLGYADGLNRLLSNRGSVLVCGQRVPIVGRVSMDLTIVDVTDVPGVAMGDEVVLIGSQGAETITAYEPADLIGTIPYEILCAISARVPRIVVD